MAVDWELRYQTGDTPWDKGEPSPALVEFLREHPVRGRVLVPGCGFGFDVRLLAAAGAEVVGLDIAPSAIERAQALIPCSADKRERYELIDFFALPASLRGGFDWVWEHTCFCAIDPTMRPQYVESVAAALRPGGQFLAVFYLNPQMDPGETGPPFGVTPAELDALFDPRFELLRDWPPARAYSNRVGRERMRLYRKK